jgi:hypothetical protein|tara:strand:+ start:2086 stop:2247 length:162 start_codon:yes stop_codon:yes gene_type:complete
MMTNAEEKLAKIELMLACETGYDNPTNPRFAPVVQVSGSQRLEIIHKIMKGRG